MSRGFNCEHQHFYYMGVIVFTTIASLAVGFVSHSIVAAIVAYLVSIFIFGVIEACE